MSNLTLRIITAFVGVPVILLVSYVDEVAFFLFTSILIVLGVIEYFELIKDNEKKPSLIIVLLSSLLIAAGAFIQLSAFMMLFSLFIMAAVASNLSSGKLSDFTWVTGSSVFPVVYFGWLLSHGILIRGIGSYEGAATMPGSVEDIGFFFLVIVFGCTFINDTGAFFTGKAFGKRRLAKNISPGKTAEGTAGGFVLSVAGAFLINDFFSGPLSWQWCVVYGSVVAAAAVVGDLVESAIKRGAAVKDSGGILPGHGGILDRFDSLFFVFPAAYYLTLVFFYLS